MRALLALVCLLLAGCMSHVKTNEEPYVIQPPANAAVYLETYRHREIFYGNEFSVSLPFLGVIPIVGDWLGGKLFQFRAGAVRPVFVPEFKEYIYETPVSSSPHPCHPAALRTPWGM